MDLTRQISLRDQARAGKNYYKALRAYQQRKDILEVMYNSIDFNKIKNKQEIRLIDLGCGPGIVGLYFYKKLSKKYKSKSIEVTFLDINPLMLTAIPKQKNFHIVKGDVTKIGPTKFSSYDIVVMKQVLDYLPKNLQIKTLKNIYKILSQNGQFILSALIPPSKKAFKLTNYLYSEREKILNPSAPIKKFIVTKDILFQWLSEIGFKNIKFNYEYEIPLSVNDFVVSFGINKREKQDLMVLYKKIIEQDKNDIFKSKIEETDIELTEKGVVVYCCK